jgi:hypothetical protein
MTRRNLHKTMTNRKAIMKRLILAIVGLGAVAAFGLHLARTKPASVPAAEPVVESAPTQPAEEVQPLTPVVQGPSNQIRHDSPDTRTAAAIPAMPPPLTTPAVREVEIKQAADTLISPQASFDQKEAIWKQLRDAGKTDQIIGELESRVAADPRSSSAAAVLGQAYYKKAGETEDARDKAIFAMKADQTLDAALNLDPENWDARYMKAAGMSYWPAELKKGNEVIEQFRTLIEQQEKQSPQPQFARTYLRLGEQYQKAGFADYASQVWQRGAALFPNEGELQKKLAEQTATR